MGRARGAGGALIGGRAAQGPAAAGPWAARVGKGPATGRSRDARLRRQAGEGRPPAPPGAQGRRGLTGAAAAEPAGPAAAAAAATTARGSRGARARATPSARAEPEAGGGGQEGAVRRAAAGGPAAPAHGPAAPPRKPSPFTAYSPATNDRYWRRRPWAVARRAARIGWELARAAATAGASWRGGRPGRDAARARALRGALVRLGAAAVKIGQAASARPDLARPAFLAELEKLQDRIPAFPTVEAMRVLEMELGRKPEEVFERLTPEPVAAASLGQVYRGRLRSSGAEVAIKVQRPRLAAGIALDAFILRRGAELLTRLSSAFGLGWPDAPGLVDAWAKSLLLELDYRLEADNCARFGELYGRLPDVHVPRAYPELTTRRVLVMGWVDGARLRTGGSDVRGEAEWGTEGSAPRRGPDAVGGAAGTPPPGPRADAGPRGATSDDLRLVAVGVRCSLEQVLGTGFYHADPHPGNLLRTSGGELAYVDFGMMGEIDAGVRHALLRAILHLVDGDHAALAASLVSLGILEERKVEAQLARDRETDRALAASLAHEDDWDDWEEGEGEEGGAGGGARGEAADAAGGGPGVERARGAAAEGARGAAAGAPAGEAPWEPPTEALSREALAGDPLAAARLEALPELADVLRGALSGGAENLSFTRLSASLAMTMYRFRFQIPPYYTLLVRSLSVLEGIALASDPDYKILAAAYPWIARRLLAASSEPLRELLLEVLYPGGLFDYGRLQALLQRAAGEGDVPEGDGGADGGAGGEGGGRAKSVPEVLRLILSSEGDFVRGVLTDEMADAAAATLARAFDAAVDDAADSLRGGGGAGDDAGGGAGEPGGASGSRGSRPRGLGLPDLGLSPSSLRAWSATLRASSLPDSLDQAAQAAGAPRGAVRGAFDQFADRLCGAPEAGPADADPSRDPSSSSDPPRDPSPPGPPTPEYRHGAPFGAEHGLNPGQPGPWGRNGAAEAEVEAGDGAATLLLGLAAALAALPRLSRPGDDARARGLRSIIVGVRGVAPGDGDGVPASATISRLAEAFARLVDAEVHPSWGAWARCIEALEDSLGSAGPGGPVDRLLADLLEGLTLLASARKWIEERSDDLDEATRRTAADYPGVLLSAVLARLLARLAGSPVRGEEKWAAPGRFSASERPPDLRAAAVAAAGRAGSRALPGAPSLLGLGRFGSDAASAARRRRDLPGSTLLVRPARARPPIWIA